jgi:hypothetical protein
MTQRSGSPWKVVAITLAIILVVVLAVAALTVSGIMKLGLGLL